MERENMKIVITGHVDHGKSTLIGRLFFDTGCFPQEKIDEVKKICDEFGKDFEFAYLMDHLEEERMQNITIDTAQTFFKTKKRDYVIIDAPGHVEFVKNMITGASQADAAILLIDAKEGLKEQTRRHSYILSMLGLKQVIVVINKMDLVSYEKKRFDELSKEIIAFLANVGIKPSYIIPISAKQGDFIAKKSTDKMPWFKGPAVLEALDTFSPRKSAKDKDLRFPIQDVYKFDDRRILAGKVEAGTLRPGDEVTFLPSGKKTKIKTIEAWNAVKTQAEAGESIGVTLEHPLFIERGEVACAKSMPKQSNSIEANVFWMSQKPLGLNERLIFKCATQETQCTIEKISNKINSSTLEIIEAESKNLKEIEVARVTIKTDKPVITENFNNVEELGRFVLERNNDTVAGGIILERVADIRSAGAPMSGAAKRGGQVGKWAGGQESDVKRLASSAGAARGGE